MGKRALAISLLTLLAATRLDADTAWRGMGQRMRVTVQGWNGGASWSRLTRSRHYSSVPFRRFRVVLQTFQPGNGTPIVDTNYTSDYFFQVGFEYPYVSGNSGIGDRVAVTFGGSNTAAYTAGNGPYGYLLSDIIDLGYDVPTNAFFGFWTTIENQAGAASASNTMPYIDNMCNNLERYEGSRTTPSSLVGSNWALTQPSITHVGTNMGGYSQGYAPTKILIEQDAAAKSILLVGDSICYGVGEGTTGSLGWGDALGSALGNSGYLARWIGETLHYNYLNFGRGSDGFKYASAQNWKYRLQLWALANPTHVVSQNLHNDVHSNVGSILTAMSNAYGLIRVACPGVPIIQACSTPNTDSSSDQYTTLTGQVPTAVFLSSNGTRNSLNAKIRAMDAGIGHNGFIDPNPLIESGYVAGDPSTITSKWIVDGTPFAYIYDGVHPGSRGAATIAAGLPGNPFLSASETNAATNTATNASRNAAPATTNAATQAATGPRSAATVDLAVNPVRLSSGVARFGKVPAGSTMRLYSIRGVLLATLKAGEETTATGNLTIPLASSNGQPLSAGIYLVRIEDGTSSKTMKLMVVE